MTFNGKAAHDSGPGLEETGAADRQGDRQPAHKTTATDNVPRGESADNGQALTQRFAGLFAGLDRAHGQFKPKTDTRQNKVSGKVETHKTRPTLDHYRRHLAGKYGLGIVPIRDDTTVAFAAIDIDDYALDLPQLDRDLQDMDVPAVVCRTKSAGAHVYLFFSEPAPADRVRAFLERLAATLGYPKAEVFPKQDRLEGEDVGNWINLPYYQGDRSTRHAVRNGDFVPLADFLELAQSQRTTIANLEAVDLPAPPATDKELEAAATGKLTWTFNPNSGLVTEGREKYLVRLTLDVFWQMHDQDGEAPSAAALTDAVWERFQQEADLSHTSGQGHRYSRKDALAKAKTTVKNYANGRLRRPGQVPAWVREMNETHAFVMEHGKATVLNVQDWDPALGRYVLTRSSPADIKTRYMNEMVQVGTDKNDNPTYKPKGNAWLAHPQRRDVADVVFAPNQNLPNYYNLWRGFSVEPAPGDWSLMKDHIFNVLCGGEERLYDYVLGWMAFTVQYPNVVPEVALVLRGKRGTGKGIFAREFGGLMKEHFLPINNAKHVTGNFNAHLQDTIVAFLDEAFWAGEKSGEGVLKTLITEPQIAIERKGKDTRLAPNYLHVIIAGNEDWVVPAGLEERRFAVLDVGEERMQDHAYFGALQKQMANGGRQAMLHELLNMDLSQFNPRNAPATAALQEQKLRSMDPMQAWWYECLWAGAQMAEGDGWKSSVVRDYLYNCYLNHAGDSTSRTYRGDKTKLGLFLQRVLPEGWPQAEQQSVEEDDWQHGGGKKVRRKWCWKFPPLDVCRATWDREMRTETEWPSEAETEPDGDQDADDGLL